jgi:hypothetical protein
VAKSSSENGHIQQQKIWRQTQEQREPSQHRWLFVTQNTGDAQNQSRDAAKSAP